MLSNANSNSLPEKQIAAHPFIRQNIVSRITKNYGMGNKIYFRNQVILRAKVCNSQLFGFGISKNDLCTFCKKKF